MFIKNNQHEMAADLYIQARRTWYIEILKPVSVMVANFISTWMLTNIFIYLSQLQITKNTCFF